MRIAEGIGWIPAGTILSGANFRNGLGEKVAFVLLHQVDLALTAMALSLGFAELNPLMRYMITVPVLLLTVKTVVPLLIAWLAPGKLLIPGIVLLAAVVGWNIRELLVYLY